VLIFRSKALKSHYGKWRFFHIALLQDKLTQFCIQLDKSVSPTCDASIELKQKGLSYVFSCNQQMAAFLTVITYPARGRNKHYVTLIKQQRISEGEKNACILLITSP
jgi:hypothetical protein